MAISPSPPRLKGWPRAPRGLEQAEHAGDEVVDVEEAPGLGPVAVHGEGLAPQRLAHEGGHHHPVAAALAGPDGVEGPHDHRLEPVIAGVDVGHELVDGLGLGVGPAADQRRAVDAVGVLAETVGGVLAVDLARRGRPGRGRRGRGRRRGRARCRAGSSAATPAAGSTMLCTPTAAARWTTRSWPATRRSTSVLVEDRALHEAQLRALQVGDVLAAPGREVVEQRDVVAVGHQAVGHGRPDEPAPPVMRKRTGTVLLGLKAPVPRRRHVDQGRTRLSRSVRR